MIESQDPVFGSLILATSGVGIEIYLLEIPA